MPFKAALVDLSGTIHVGPTALPCTVEALARLRQALPVRFVSNTSALSRRALVQQLQGMGIEVQPQEIFTSLSSARQLIKDERLRPYLLLHPDALPDFEDLPPADGPPNAVVVGLAKEAFTYQRLNEAFRILHSQPEARLIALHRGLYYKEPDGFSLGPGPFVTALEQASGKKATVVGKPEPSFFQLVLSELGIEAKQAVMVGDDIVSDVGGAQAVGMTGVLVRTGKYQPGDESSKGVQAAATVDGFAEAVDYILSHAT